jgi:hypothetical protein
VPCRLRGKSKILNALVTMAVINKTLNAFVAKKEKGATKAIRLKIFSAFVP